MPDFDADRAAAFRGRLEQHLNAAALALLISLGHRAGLFDVMARLPAVCPEEIAGQAGLDARYVRAWLTALAAGGVLERDAEAGTFRLPPEHAAALTRAAQPHNLAAACQWIPELGAVEERLLACFERGGGMPESAWPRARALEGEASTAPADPAGHPLGPFLYTVQCLRCLPAALASGGLGPEGSLA
jgi:hypothetical protein